MRQFIESLKRLYNANKITKEKIDSLFSAGKITEAERDFLLK